MPQRYKFFALLLSLCFQSSFAMDANSPVGYWKTIDDVTGKQKSIIQISEAPNHTLMGRVIKIFPKPGEDQHKVCAVCKGDKHNQPIVGMVVLSGLKKHDGMWDGGQILDPANGKFYDCTLKFSDNIDRLNVRGYIGIPLLGRSQVWIRTSQ